MDGQFPQPAARDAGLNVHEAIIPLFIGYILISTAPLLPDSPMERFRGVSASAGRRNCPFPFEFGTPSGFSTTHLLLIPGLPPKSSHLGRKDVCPLLE